jgi:hypothetical protein
MRALSEERLAELIGALPPAPPGWVQAAVELPAARVAIDDLVARPLEDESRRRAVLADLAAALRAAGVDPTPELLEGLRARLSSPQR